MIARKEDLNRILMENFKQISNEQRIYHYSSCETTVNNIIVKQSLKFSNPIIFNDPFDCSEKILNVTYDRDLIDKTLKDMNYNRKQRRNLKTSEIKAQQNSIMKEEREKYKICCFSGKNDEVLMWSHYADKHHGICCGFEFPIDHKNFTVAPVNYKSSVNKLEGETELYKIIYYWLTTKSDVWEYENEYRAILNSKSQSSDFEIINYDQNFLKEIVFGCGLKNKEIEKIISELKSKKIPLKNIELKRAQLNPETFNLKILDL